MHRYSIFMYFCIVAMQLLHQLNCMPPPELRAHLEARVVSAMSLKDIEKMVENDDRVLNAPKSKIIILPKPKAANGELSLDDMEQKAYIIQRKPKKYPKKASTERSGFGFSDREFEDIMGRSSYEPRYRFESAFKLDEEFPSLFSVDDLESAGTNPVKSFYESIVQKAMADQNFARDPLAILEAAASEDVPSYKPRFDYDSYSKDPTEVKLKGKKYWREAPERRDETVDENGCRTVVKKIMNPENGKKSNGDDAKSVIITKECEYPNLNGPEAKIPEIEPNLRLQGSRMESDLSANFDTETPTYQASRPVELELGDSKTKDALAPDYIDKMLETHFRSFPSFSNPITSFKGYQDRFKLRTPPAFKDVKPIVDVHSYEYSHPQSGFESENTRDQRDHVSSPVEYKNEAPQTYQGHREYDYVQEKAPRETSYNNDAPQNYGRGHRDYDYIDKSHRNAGPQYESLSAGSPKVREHHYHYDYPEKSSRKPAGEEEDQDQKENSKSSDKKAPKMMKKSFAYYRKDKPKEDPNDQHYAEEYAQGNYRSFSSDYDSERDGPKKE